MRAVAQQPAGDAGVLELERYLPYRLSLLSNTVSREIARRYQADFGLSIPEWRVMAVLGRFPGLSASEVVARTAMDKVTVSRAVDRLGRAGYLNRSADAADRRRRSLSLSRSGQRVYARIVPLALAYEAELLAALPAEARRQLDALLETLTARARALAGEVGP